MCDLDQGEINHEVEPKLSRSCENEEEVRNAVEPLILEYFQNGDFEDLLFSLEQMLLIGARPWIGSSLGSSAEHGPQAAQPQENVKQAHQ